MLPTVIQFAEFGGPDQTYRSVGTGGTDVFRYTEASPPNQLLRTTNSSQVDPIPFLYISAAAFYGDRFKISTRRALYVLSPGPTRSLSAPVR